MNKKKRTRRKYSKMIKSIISFVVGFLVGTIFGATIIRMAFERLSG